MFQETHSAKPYKIKSYTVDLIFVRKIIFNEMFFFEASRVQRHFGPFEKILSLRYFRDSVPRQGTLVISFPCC